MNARWLSTCAALGFSAVALGAFGAHGLKAVLGEAPEAAQRLAWWQTAAQYHLAHALAVGLAALLPRPKLAGGLFVAGVALFSGSLYLMALTGYRPLGAVTPVGGVGLLAGWVAVGLAARGSRFRAGPHESA